MRITNTFGPRHQMKHDRYGVVNWFVRLALDNKTLPLMGDGRILRDYLYVEDLIDALLLGATSDKAYGKIYNVGTGRPTNFIDLAEMITRIAGSGHLDYVPYSDERKQLEPGDYYTDITKITSEIGWEPKVSLEQGLEKTVAYYRQHRQYYGTPHA